MPTPQNNTIAPLSIDVNPVLPYVWDPPDFISNTGGSLSAVGEYVADLDRATNAANGGGAAPGRLVLLLPECDRVKLKFLSAGVDGATAAGRIWGLEDLRSPSQGAGYVEEHGIPLVDLTALTASGQTWPSTSRCVPTPTGLTLRTVDIITVGTDWTRGDSAQSWAEAADGFAVLSFDPSGCHALVFEGLLGTATRLAVLRSTT